MSWFLLMTQPAGGGAQTNPIVSFLPIIFIVVIFYFLLIRPQQKRAKQVRTMMEGLKSGDSVVTVGGLHGTVAAVDQDTVILRVADNVKLTFNKSAIAGLVSQKE